MTRDPLLLALHTFERHTRARALWAFAPRMAMVGVLAFALGWLIAGSAGALVLAIVGVCLAFAFGVWRTRKPLTAIARDADERFSLHDQLATALDILQGKIAPSALAERQMAQARRVAQTLSPQQMPYVTRWRDVVALLALCGAVAVCLWAYERLPRPASAQAAALASEDVRDLTQDARDALRSAQAEIAQDATLAPELRQALLSTLEQSLNALNAPDLSAEQAFATLNSTAEALSQVAQALAPVESADAQTLAQTLDALNALTPNSESLAQARQALAEGDTERARANVAQAQNDLAQPNPARDNALERAQDALQADAQALAEAEAQQAGANEGQAQNGQTGDGAAQGGQEGNQPAPEGEEGGQSAQGDAQGEGEGEGGAQENATQGEDGASQDSPDGGTPTDAQGGQSSQNPDGQGARDRERIFAPVVLPDAPADDANDIRLETDPNAPLASADQASAPMPQAQFIPFSEAYGAYNAQAQRQLNNPALPEGLRSAIRAYFEGIAP
jgi:hypothetical protein